MDYISHDEFIAEEEKGPVKRSQKEVEIPINYQSLKFMQLLLISQKDFN